MAQKYKVKLESGRVLGPIDLERVRLLILKKHILGKELGRIYPTGDWVAIGTIPEIADLLVSHAAGKLDPVPVFFDAPTRGSSASTHILPGATGFHSIEEIIGTPDATVHEPESDEDSEKTQIATRSQIEFGEPPGKHTMFGLLEKESSSPVALESSRGFNRAIARQETVMIRLPKKKKKIDIKEAIKATLAAIALGIAGYQVLFSQTAKPRFAHEAPIRPTLPTFQQKRQPDLSKKIYTEGLKYYVLDNAVGYRIAAQKFSESAGLDINNVKALALLASSYINLIDSSNKDENYFSVISKLIDMTRAKNLDLVEGVIADVELFCVVNKGEAAENRIVQYTKIHPDFSIDLFYYLALALYTRADYQGASRYISQIPDNKAFSAKVFYLQGRIAEKLDDSDSALIAYMKAVHMNSAHARSRLRIADILNQRGRLSEAKEHLEYLVSHAKLLSPKDLGLAYYLHSILSEQNKNYEIALGDAERAVRLDQDDHNYLLQLYSMRAKAGESIINIRKDAKMYYYLGEGERLLKDGKHQEALTQFLLARQSNNASPIPLMKIGDMFSYLHDLGNARINYKMAADRAPNNIDIWSKYIDVLIQSFEWDEAQRAMDRFRQLPVSQSAIDKAAGDMYEKQGRYAQAQLFYRKAMARDSIDPSVYIAYAKSLMSTHDYKDAPFFFALAQRYDPLNIDAIVGTAKCIAYSDSIERAIGMLPDELERGDGAKAELLSAIAEFQIQKGDWDEAQKTVKEAMNANPDYAYPWKLQAQIYMNRADAQPKLLDRALFAYQAYSDRNASDPSGYLERYRIFVKKNELDKAGDELAKIYGTYPKYPGLHYDKGILYGLLGNHKLAVEEYKIELQNEPNSVDAMLALGKEYVEMNAYNDALVLFDKAMILAPHAGEPKHQAGYANYLLKNYAGAVALYQAALAIDPQNPLIYKRLGLAYRDLGDQRDACAAFQKYTQMEPDAPDRSEFEKCW